MFAQLVANYRRVLATGSFPAMAEARRDVAGTMEQYFGPMWPVVQEVACTSPHCFSSEYYAHSSAGETLARKPENRAQLEALTGLPVQDALLLWDCWLGERISGMSNYAGD